MYEYRAKLIRVVDGDTVWLDVDLGCDIHTNLSIRLYGINAPEMPTPEGVVAKQFAEEYFEFAGNIILRTIKDRKEKYGRYLGVIQGDVAEKTLNDDLVDSGHAERVTY